jgi:hypothetical protein
MASLDRFVNKGHKKYFIHAKTVYAKSAILFFLPFETRTFVSQIQMVLA